MEFGEPGAVTLLHFTPLSTDTSYGAPNYERCDTFSASTASDQCCNMGGSAENHCVMSMETANSSLPQHPYDYLSQENCEVYSGLGIEQSSNFCNHHPGQEYDTTGEYGGVLINSTDSLPPVGPPPVRLPRLEGSVSIDLNIDTNYPSPGSSMSGTYLSGPHSTPHSPLSMSDAVHRKGYGSIKTYQKNRTKSPRSNMVLRSTSPMFPDQSTPLSNLKRQPSSSSIASSRSGDQLSMFSASVKSEPCIYADSSVDSPSISMSPAGLEAVSASNSTKAETTLETSTRSCLELEMPVKYARRITDLDKKILKLQVERSKVLEKAHQTKSSNALRAELETWWPSERFSVSEMGKVHLYIVPLGIHELDEPLYDDANKLLRQVGGLYLDLQTAISIFRSVCCKGTSIQAEISTCFAYIKSFLHGNQKLKLANLQGFYSIQCDLDGSIAEGELPSEFKEALASANEVLRCAQYVTLPYINIQTQLQKLRQIAAGKVDGCDSICLKLGIMDRERRGQIRAVMEGNCTTMASAERVWPQHYQDAMQTIKTITECIHPTATAM